MIKVFILSVLASVSCCGHELDFLIEPDDGRFYRYRAFFEKHTGHRTDGIPIFYKNRGGDTIASCSSVKYGGKWHNKHIKVDKDKFDSLSVNWRRLVIAHELVHCHLEHAGHTETEDLELMNAEFDTQIPLRTDKVIELIQRYRK